MVDTYRIRIIWVGLEGKPLYLGFINPPSRRHIRRILRRNWLKSSVEDQDTMWEAILITAFIPTKPWIGTITTLYGTVESYIERLYWNT